MRRRYLCNMRERINVQRQIHGKASAACRYLVDRLRIEDIRQQVFQQFAAVPSVFPLNGGWVRRGSFLQPFQSQLSLIGGAVYEVPAYGNPSPRCQQRAIFQGVGRELVDDQRERLHDGVLQVDLWSVKTELLRDGRGAERFELHPDQSLQGDRVAIRARKQSLRSRQCIDPATNSF